MVNRELNFLIRKHIIVHIIQFYYPRKNPIFVRGLCTRFPLDSILSEYPRIRYTSEYGYGKKFDVLFTDHLDDFSNHNLEVTCGSLAMQVENIHGIIIAGFQTGAVHNVNDIIAIFAKKGIIRMDLFCFDVKLPSDFVEASSRIPRQILKIIAGGVYPDKVGDYTIFIGKRQ